MSTPFPFSAIAGQEEMKRALLATAVDASIGGVLVFGDRGTGKSTAVRGLAALLPKVAMNAGCPFGDDPLESGSWCEACKKLSKKSLLKSHNRQRPVVDLPLGTTEDRLVGSLNLERALAHGEKSFEPGLLADAHRGFLYIDEVNLLEDHLVDLLLDVAATGENVVEREGLSVRHPAKFVLVGSGNPEEGELRPQLLDRFGLSVEVTTPVDLETRMSVIKRRDEFDRDPDGFVARYKRKDSKIRKQIADAQKRLENIQVPDVWQERAIKLCMELGTDGLRGELTLIRVARAMAALDGDGVVNDGHLREVAASSLRHRLRRNPLDETGSTVRVQRAVDKVFGD